MTRVSRRRDQPLAMGDRIALGIGVALAALMLAAFTWRLAQTVALVIAGGAVIGGVMMALGLRLADWREPESEQEFDRVVERSERLARQGTAAEPDEVEFLDLDPYDDEDFEELVREALDELPDLLQEALQRNVAVVISDGGRRAGAYGLRRSARGLAALCQIAAEAEAGR